jgi:hypothetical protein
MRTIEYLSPSSISTFKYDPKEFYLRYLASTRSERDPQTRPMAIGSAFDAFVKSYLHENLIGTTDPRFDRQTIFETQVGREHWEWAYKNAEYVFEEYKQSGALADLVLLLRESPTDPRFEFELRGTKHGMREGIEGQFGQVVLLGRPDVDFITRDGVHVILDFKVTGYCGYSKTSPKPGYIRMRSAGRTNYGKHMRCRPFVWHGLEINAAQYLEEVDEGWARQLAIYAWLCGEPIGSEFVTIIHQLTCSYNPNGLPTVRVAEHHNKISPEFQQKTFNEALDLWDRCHSDHFFRDLTKEQSDDLCRLLEGRAAIIQDPLYDVCR